MAKGMYIGVNNTAKKVKKMYVGVGDTAKKVKKIYVGVNGVAKLCYTANDIKPYLEAWSENIDFTLYTANSSKLWDGTLQYSFDLVNWTTWDGTSGINVGRRHIYLRGIGNTAIHMSTVSNRRLKFEGCEYVSGTLEALLDYQTVENGGHPTMGAYAFHYLFQGSALVSAENLIMPSANISNYGLNSMFYGCSSLISAPKIFPSLNIGQYGYSSMFTGCTNLVNAPEEISATTVDKNACEYMFSGCISITAAPAIKATTLGYYCFRRMFQGCSSLSALRSDLPATTLVAYCYNYMFYNCSSLKVNSTSGNKIFTCTSKADSCVSAMLNGTQGGPSNPTVGATYYWTP